MNPEPKYCQQACKVLLFYYLLAYAELWIRLHAQQLTWNLLGVSAGREGAGAIQAVYVEPLGPADLVSVLLQGERCPLLPVFCCWPRLRRPWLPPPVSTLTYVTPGKESSTAGPCLF